MLHGGKRLVSASCFAALLDMKVDIRLDMTLANTDRYSASNIRRFVPPSPTGTSSFARHFGQRPT